MNIVLLKQKYIIVEKCFDNV